MSKIYKYKAIERNHNIMIAEGIGNHQYKRYEVLERYSFYTMDSGKIKKSNKLETFSLLQKTE